jgi:hypothetical protein
VRAIEGIDVDDLAGNDPVEALVAAMGLPPGTADLISVGAPADQPGSGNETQADLAVAELLRMMDGGGDDETAAARICVLVTPDGDLVAVPLDGIPFGYGPHRCPGEEIARALAS